MGTYLITGASSGIGAACAKELNKKGHQLILVARDETKLLEFAKSLHYKNYTFAFDLEEVDKIKDIFEFCKNEGLKLDGLIYSAGMNADVPLKVSKPDLFMKVLKVNCVAFTEMGKLFFSKKYSNDNSRIVAISSSASISCDKGMGLYSASKAALNAVVKTMAKEYVRRGILVNAVLPAGVLTPMAIAKMETISGVKINLDQAIEELENNQVKINEAEAQPLGIIPPSSVAKIVTYLVSDDNKYVTGTLLPVSGGLNF